MAEYKVGNLGSFKIIDKQKRIVGGYFGDDNVDTDGHMIPKEAYLAALDEYLSWGSIRDAHKGAVGKITDYGTKGWNYIEVQIFDDNAWKLVENGVYKGFSIGAKVYEKSIVPFASIAVDKFKNVPKATLKALKTLGKILRIDSMLLVEISLTDRPVNQAALFAKSEDGSDLTPLPSIMDMEKTMDNQEQAETVVDTAMPETEKEVAAEPVVVPGVVTDENPVAQPAINAAPDVNLVKETNVDVEKSTVNDGTVGNNGMPTQDSTEAAQPDPMQCMMDNMKTYMDAGNTNLYNALVEQMNIAINMLGEKLTAQITAFQAFMQQQMNTEETQETTSDTSAVENKSTVIETEIPVVTEVLTTDVVKNIVKDIVDEAIGSLNTIRKGAINGGQEHTEPVSPDFKTMTKQQLLENTALHMAGMFMKK